MPQSLSNVRIHLVFSTKHRAPRLMTDLREELYPYLGGLLGRVGCIPILIGGVEDHVHLLFVLSRTMTIAQVTEKVKTSSTRWIRGRQAGPADFGWQSGYGAFSVGPRESPMVEQYIAGQEAHHARVSFQDEYRQLLREAGVDGNESYMWD